MGTLTKREEKLLAERLDFYVALDTGERTPTTLLQKHFVDVCKGIKKAQRDDEIAYAKYKESLENSIIKATPSAKRVGRVNPIVHKPSLPQKPHSKGKIKPIAKHIGNLEEFNMVNFPNPVSTCDFGRYDSSRPRSGQVKETKWKNSVSRSSGSSNSHIKSWMKPKGNKTIDRVNEFSKGSVPKDNWATRDDIRKDSKANWSDGRKNKFF